MRVIMLRVKKVVGRERERMGDEIGGCLEEKNGIYL